MEISLPKKLKILSYYLPGIYIVGGYVRNALLGLPVSDIDVAGEYTVDEVLTALSMTEFTVHEVNKRLGTVKIGSCEDKDFFVEYTTFRTDSYPIGSGSHLPTDVIFTKDILKDSFRRDFSVNALYYSVDTAEIVDLTGGRADLERKILRTTRAPEKVFSEDGLRILRLVRFSAELNFSIDSATFSVAKRMVDRLQDISKERIRDEFMKILVADTKYNILGNEDAHLRGVKMLDELGALKYIVPELLEGKGLLQNAKYHIYDVYLHSLYTMYYCPSNIRFAGLLHDIGKPMSQRKDGNMYRHSDFGQIIAKDIMGKERLRFSNKDIYKTCRLIGAHMYDMDGLTSEKKLRMFIVDNIDIIDDIIALKRADAKASTGDKNTESISANKIENILNVMRTDNTPLSMRELCVTGDDLLDTKLPEDKRAWAMRKVLEHAVCHEDCRTRETQLLYLKGLNYGNN